MSDSWHYIEGRMAEQRSNAEQRRRVVQARNRNGSALRLSSLFRASTRDDDALDGCKQ